MVRASDLREKEVINVRDGARLGLISDIEVSLEKGEIQAIVLPGPGRIFGLFGKNNDYVVKWKDIIKIGNDVVLIDFNYEWETPRKKPEDEY